YAAAVTGPARLADAEAAHEEGLEVARALVARSPDATGYRADLAAGHHNYAVFLLEWADRTRAAEGGFRRSAGTLRRLVAEVPDRDSFRSDLANSQLYLGRALAALGRDREAAEALRQARDGWQRLHDKSTASSGYARDLLRAGAEVALREGKHAD